MGGEGEGVEEGFAGFGSGFLDVGGGGGGAACGCMK